LTTPASATRPLVIAHRGDWLEGDDPRPQNSLVAVLSALGAGADGAEVDARLSANGTVVLHHDAGIGRADIEAGCDAPEGAPICALADAALRHLGTLAELLARLAERSTTTRSGGWLGPVVLNIELKDLPGEPGWASRYLLARHVAGLLDASHLASAALCQQLRPGFGAAPSPSSPPVALSPEVPSSLEVIVSSFDPGALDHFRRYSPGTTTALLLEEGDDWRYHLDRTEGLSAVNPEDVMAVPELFATAASRGLAVIPWTVDSADRALQLAALGAAGLITNRPRALLEALSRV
jgi:glycerophosphoryl diester phosphodiesterase